MSNSNDITNANYRFSYGTLSKGRAVKREFDAPAESYHAALGKMLQESADPVIWLPEHSDTSEKAPDFITENTDGHRVIGSCSIWMDAGNLSVKINRTVNGIRVAVYDKANLGTPIERVSVNYPGLVTDDGNQT